MIQIYMIPINQRDNWLCSCCGTNKSVKYIYSSNGSTFPLCNKCITKYSMTEKRIEKESHDEKP